MRCLTTCLNGWRRNAFYRGIAIRIVCAERTSCVLPRHRRCQGFVPLGIHSSYSFPRHEHRAEAFSPEHSHSPSSQLGSFSFLPCFFARADAQQCIYFSLCFAADRDKASSRLSSLLSSVLLLLACEAFLAVYIHSTCFSFIGTLFISVTRRLRISVSS